MMTDQPDFYAMFLNALNGLIDDAEMSGWDADGLTSLREAHEFFSSDYRIRQQSQNEGRDREAELRRDLET
jgi:hypothetical protein